MATAAMRTRIAHHNSRVVLAKKSTALSLTQCRSRAYATPSSPSSSTSPENYDIVIVGGGPAGLALAGALASSPAVYATSRIALVEAGSLARVEGWEMQEGEYSNRVSSITNVSREFLQDCGAWDYVDESRTMPVEDMQVWDGVSDARISFTPSDLPLPARSPHPHPSRMATMVENLQLQRALLRLLKTKPAVRLLDNVKVAAIRRSAHADGDWPLVGLSDGRTLRARLLIGADGHNSPVRSYAQISSYGWPYPTHALVATLLHAAHPLASASPNTTAYQRFLPTGPVAFLPLSPTAASLVWSTTPPLAGALKALDPPALAHCINAAFRLPWRSLAYLHTLLLDAHASGTPLTPAQATSELAFRERAHGIAPTSALSSDLSNTLGMPSPAATAFPPLITALQPGSTASFPLRLMHAAAYLGARTALIGDAAHGVHPLAGQGLNMGLADARALAAAVDAGVRAGADIGARTTLQPYARARYVANHSVLAVTDKLHTVYGTDAAPVVWARSAGLEVVNELSAVKGALMASAGAVSEQGAASAGWNFAADGVQVVLSSLHTARTILAGLGTMAGTAAGRAVGSIIMNGGKR